MNNFDWSLYDDESPSVPVAKKATPKETASFDWSIYDTAPEKPSETATTINDYLKDWFPTSEQREKATRETAAGIARGATLGLSKYIEPEGIEETKHTKLGEFVGMTLPFEAGIQLFTAPLRFMKGLSRFAEGAFRVGAAAATGATMKGAEQVIAGEEIKPLEIAEQGLAFGTLDALLRGSISGYQWFKSLNPAQQSKFIIDGILPQNMSPNSYKFFADEVVPELQNIAQNEYKAAYTNAIQQANTKYQQQLANTRARHENDLLELAKTKQLSEADYAKAQFEYQNKLKQVAAEHEYELSQIEKSNEKALKEYEVDKQKWDKAQTRQQAVETALNTPPPEGISLRGRVTAEGEPLGLEIERPPEPHSLRNTVGEIFSPRKITNETSAGYWNMQAMRAADEAEYRTVNELYNKSELLNKDVVVIQPNLVNSLKQTIKEISAIPEPSPPQKQLLNSAQKILNDVAVFDEFGNVVGYKPISNHILLEQAKALRFSMDFDFAHANVRGIFNPTVNALQDAAEMGASFVRNEEAIIANKKAREAYAEWVSNYRNKYTEPYADLSNKDYAKTFEKSLDVDTFMEVDKVLRRTNAGQQLANETKRALIDKHLGKYFENPRKAVGHEFEEAMAKIDPVLFVEERRAIREAFSQARGKPSIVAKKAEVVKEPKEPKLKEMPTQVKIPTFKGVKPEVKEISEVKIPLKAEVKPSKEMTAASKKMNITPEKVMSLTDTPTGFKQVKSELSKTEAGSKLIKRIEQQKLRDMIFEGKVKHKFDGSELARVMNKGDNFAMLTEILGEEQANALLDAAIQIGKKRVTIENLKKTAKHVGVIKTAITIGLL